MRFFVFWLLGIVVGVVTTLTNPAIKNVHLIVTNLLFYQLVITVTLAGIQGFIGHVLMSDMVAEYIGWQKGSPFQKELGYSELGMGISGVLCIWMSKDSWLAIIVIFCTLFLGATVVHIKEMIKNKNFNAGNSFVVLPDVIIPVTLIVLYIIRYFS
ncbi:DUF6790 family protein [Clostridium felsineum]|uniref:DUF6790 family protein n=1 Tax=Clostridium felsineum TaxID=36839 RepID=UPI00098BE6E4|nr:DUF6790 family protein [Clostridium felsineum]URZ17108.1 hypothetical protein CLFE_031600 [Clostridium felsineum DSM 794]